MQEYKAMPTDTFNQKSYEEAMKKAQTVSRVGRRVSSKRGSERRTFYGCFPSSGTRQPMFAQRLVMTRTEG